MRRQEEEAVRETKRARRARQRRPEHQKVEQPRTAQEYAPVDGEKFQPAASVSHITPFDEMEELG